jgi:hypothetical protein
MFKEVRFEEKMNEVIEIFNEEVNLEEIQTTIIKRYEEHLKGFKELKTMSKLSGNENKIFIKYININGKFGHGGFLTDFDDRIITLKIGHSKPWNILIDENFIFYQRKILPDDEGIFIKTI